MNDAAGRSNEKHSTRIFNDARMVKSAFSIELRT